jgi:hypothetical protein
MALLRIVNGFDRLADADLLVRARTIIDSMSGNPVFPTPTPDMSVVTQGADEFEEALSAAEDGNSYLKAVKNEKRTRLINLLHSLSNYVLFTANGDKIKALRSGFRIAKDSQPAPPISKPVDLRVTEGANPGELYVVFKKVQGARSYMVEFATEPVTAQTLWQNQACTMSKCTLKGLDSNKRYQVRIAAVGIHEQVLYSDPVSRVVQ